MTKNSANEWQLHLAEFDSPRFDSYLVKKFPELTRARAQKLINEEKALINNLPAKASQKVKAQMQISLRLDESPRPTSLSAEAIPLNILYEDTEMIVIDKAPGLVVHPAHGNWSGTLVNALLHHCGPNLGKNSFNIGGELRPGIVHRIDKNTSGVLIIAKTDRSLQGLAKQFKEHTIIRKYIGICWGQLPASGEYSGSIGRDPKHRQRMTIIASGKNALTHFQKLESLGIASLFEAILSTGRTHQIRVHFSHAGFPLVGDAIYASATRAARRAKEAAWQKLLRNSPEIAEQVSRVCLENSRHLLHAHFLRIVHPISEKILEFQAPLPADFVAVLTLLRKALEKV